MELPARLAELDFSDVGALPRTVKAACFAAVAGVVLAAGHLLVTADKRTELALASRLETELRRDFDDRRGPAAGLESRRRRHREATAALGALLRRLPQDTEVPGLIDDISQAAVGSALTIDRVELGDERQVGFYRELPIAIAVRGRYRDLAKFADAVAALPRLLTLHDFELEPRTGPDDLSLSIEARTYRYVEQVPAESQPPVIGS